MNFDSHFVISFVRKSGSIRPSAYNFAIYAIPSLNSSVRIPCVTAPSFNWNPKWDPKHHSKLYTRKSELPRPLKTSSFSPYRRLLCRYGR